MTESIGELRRICQETKEPTNLRQFSWFGTRVTRRISIYFTKLFLEIGISANQASLLGLLVLIIAGAFFVFSDARWWFIGLLLLYLSFVVDCVDGEIARYNKSASSTGTYLDGIIGVFAPAYIMACASFGIYDALHTSLVFVFGFLAGMGYLSASLAGTYRFIACYLWGQSVDKPIGNLETVRESTIIRAERTIWMIFFSVPGLGFIPQFFVVTMIDFFIAPFMVGALIVSARFLYLSLCGLGMLAAVSARIYYNVVHNYDLWFRL